MTKEVTKVQNISAETISKLILHGDVSGLTDVEAVQYYNKVCETVGLNPLTKPFDYIKLSGKEVLYANKGCAEQLRAIHKVSIKITQIQKLDDIYVVAVEASMPDGRTDSASGAVPIAGLTGENLANAFLKCETKAKRRVTLSICGLNMLDETEVASIPGAQVPTVTSIAPPVVMPPKEPSKEEKKEPSRVSIGSDIMRLQKAMQITNEDLAQWALNKFNKDTLKALTLAEMISFRDELEGEFKGARK